VPSRWEIMLAGPQGAAIPLAAPQAVVSGWLDDPPVAGGESVSGTGARSGHAVATRAWACGPFGTVTPAGGGPAAAVTVLQVRLLDDSLADRLQRATRPGRSVRLGACQYQVAGPARQVSEVTWAGLREWQGERAWQVRFVTPVCLRRGNRTSPWPAPDSVARGLAERWHRLHPATAPPLPERGAGPVWVSDIDGHSETQILTRRARHDGRREVSSEVISGFTGRIRYACDRGTDAEAAGFSALLAFATFAGAGSHTTYGFGVVCPEPTWQPPTVQAGQR
jgi:CRISPR-associated endoribonuclease Cas6